MSPQASPSIKLCPPLTVPRPAALLTQEDQGAEVEDAPHPTARQRFGSHRLSTARTHRPGTARHGGAGGCAEAGQGGRRPRRPGPALPGPIAHTAAGSAPLRPRVVPAAGLPPAALRLIPPGSSCGGGLSFAFLLLLFYFLFLLLIFLLLFFFF